MILAFPLLWAVGAAAAYWYSQDRGIPWATALAALPAFLLEVSFYYVLGVERLRARLEKLPLAVLGQLMWFRTGLFAMLSVRRVKNVGFGFWPAPKEWEIGTLYFVLLLPVAGTCAWFLKVARPHLEISAWERTTVLAVATF